MDQEARISQWHAHAVQSNARALNDALADMETVAPVTERQWHQMNAIFKHLNRPAWAEIMTARFLQVEPVNLAARLEEVMAMSEALSRRSEAIDNVEAVVKLPYNRAEQFLGIGTIYARCERAHQAAIWFARARDAEPDNLNIRFSLFWNFFHLRQTKQARNELVAIFARVAHQIEPLTTVSSLASMIGDQTLAAEAYDAAAGCLPAASPAQLGTLLLQAARLKRASDIVRIALSTDFNQIGSLTALDEIYAVLECHGLHDSMRRVVGAALALSPGDARFTARERALSAPHRLMFASTPAQAPSSAPSGRRTVIRDRMRDLLFWR